MVEPAPPDATEADELTLVAAAAITREAPSDPLTATAVPAPHRARTRPAARRTRPRVAITAARQASPASASAPAAGARSWPVTVMACEGSGRGAR